MLPEFVLPSEDLTVALTLRDLLCHRHGLECGPIVHRDALAQAVQLGHVLDSRSGTLRGGGHRRNIGHSSIP